MFKINNKDVSNLSISRELINKLKEKDLNYIEDVWILKRINLKALGFTYDEIKEIVISLQLIGLDLNKKKY